MPDPEVSTEPATPAQPLKRFTDLLDLGQRERIKEELRILEGLMAQAVRDKDWGGTLKIFEAAHKLLLRVPSK
jgi:hypothetical protein